ERSAHAVEIGFAVDAGFGKRRRSGAQTPETAGEARAGAQLAFHLVEGGTLGAREEDAGDRRLGLPGPVHVGALEMRPVGPARIGLAPAPEVALELGGRGGVGAGDRLDHLIDAAFEA